MAVDGPLNLILVLGVILGGVGYAFGQFTSQRRRGQSDALDVALKEIDALRVRSERQDRELATMRTEVLRLGAENDSFRTLLVGATPTEAIRMVVAAEVDRILEILQ